MQRVEDERFERHNKKTSSDDFEQPGDGIDWKAVKSAYANGEYESAIGLFNDAVEAADGGAFSSADEEDKIEESLSARKGLATAYQASGDLTKAAATSSRTRYSSPEIAPFSACSETCTPTWAN